jgi:hypothetical protein
MRLFRSPKEINYQMTLLMIDNMYVPIVYNRRKYQ